MINGNPLPHGHYSEKLGLTRQHLHGLVAVQHCRQKHKVQTSLNFPYRAVFC